MLRKGYQLIETFIDRGISAYTGENSDRGDLKAIMDLARAGRIKRGTHIVVESLDRLSRQEITAALAFFLSLIVDAGLTIDSTFDDQIYTKERCDADPFAAMGAILVSMRGNNESRMKSKRAKDARNLDRKNAREHKIPVNSRCPVWLNVEGKRGEKRRFVHRGERVAVVRKVFQVYDDDLGCISVTKLLNVNGIKSFTGSTWNPGAVQRLLRNEAVKPQIYIRKGKRVPDGQGKIEGYYPEIISPALFDRVQRKSSMRIKIMGRTAATMAAARSSAQQTSSPGSAGAHTATSWPIATAAIRFDRTALGAKAMCTCDAANRCAAPATTGPDIPTRCSKSSFSR